ncbi:MAG: GTPase Era [Clostridia bacterium]|nr:GTPase Era [Clostridia bacterium]MBQ8269134.1 GTPase Era [Clostridia bacterium]
MKRTAFIAFIGRPNVGKSTLLNAILGEKVAIVSKKPQTTRNRITGIHTAGEDQMVFLDTPGVHKPRTKLGDFMVKTATDTLSGVDAAVLVVEAREAVGDIEASLIEKIKASDIPAILVINKIDAVRPANIAKTIEAYAAVHSFEAVVPISAKHGKGVDTVLSECGKFLYESEWFFPDDILTDQPERQLAAEVIREKLLRLLEEEIPHGTAVSIEEWKEKRDVISIRAEIYCEKASHKGMIIGKNGKTIKTVGTYAREDLEKMLGTRIFLDLYVRVKENWRDSDFTLRNFGYNENN